MPTIMLHTNEEETHIIVTTVVEAANANMVITVEVEGTTSEMAEEIDNLAPDVVENIATHTGIVRTQVPNSRHKLKDMLPRLHLQTCKEAVLQTANDCMGWD